MTKLIYRLENSFEAQENSVVADIMAGFAFFVAIGAGLSWLML